mgnify:CR=1 FL=1
MPGKPVERPALTFFVLGFAQSHLDLRHEVPRPLVAFLGRDSQPLIGRHAIRRSTFGPSIDLIEPEL